MAKNIEIHMNSYAWLAKVVAEKMIKNKMSKISFHARKKRSVEILVSNIYFLFTQDIYKQFATRIGSKAHETMEKELFEIYYTL